ncbi:PrpF domain-containing protein, partial [Acinetobacter baumannii]
NELLKNKLESIRLAIGEKMNLGNVKDKTVPKMCIISPPLQGGTINTRTFLPQVCHEAIGVLGAISVGTACLLKGSITDGMAKINNEKT